MQTSNSKDSERLPKVALITDKNNLTLPLAKELIKSYCAVDVISENPTYWKKRYRQNKDSFLGFKEIKSVSLEKKYSYVVCLSLRSGRNERVRNRRFKLANKLARKHSAKALFIFPFTQNRASKKKVDKFVLKNLGNDDFAWGVVYTGEILDKAMDTEEGEYFPRLIKEAIKEKKVVLPKKSLLLYPVVAKKAAKEIIKLLFSFGFIGKETAILSTPISVLDFFKLLKRSNPELERSDKNIDWGTNKRLIKQKINIRQDLDEELNLVFLKLKEKQHEDAISIGKKKSKPIFRRINKIKLRKKPTSKVRGIGFSKSAIYRTGFSIFFLLALPYFLIMASISGMIFAKEQALKGNLNTANKVFVFSKKISQATNSTFYTFSRIPVVKILTKPFLPTTSFLVSATKTGIEGVSLVEDFVALFEKSTGEDVYNVERYTNKLELDLDTFYKKASFLQIEAEQLSGVGGFLVKSITPELTLKSLRDHAYHAKDVTSVLATLLGEERQKTYLVIIQDNAELRPTGGRINAIALITFNRGRVVEIDTQSVYDADKFLTGFVEPPEPLRKYLGKNSWNLQESNWDPDFPTSAERAEWFLDKEIDKQVDGVIAIDLEFIRKLINFTAPIKLASQEKEISEGNLYSIVFENANLQSNPRSKAVFYTELLDKTLLEITNLSEKERPLFLGVLIEGLEAKNIQIFLHNRIAQRAISELGWDGAVLDYTCEGNCLSDWLGIIESNFSGEPTSMYLEKQARLEVTFEEGVVKKKLLLSLIYEPIEGRGVGNYKSYIRVITPLIYGFSPAEISDSSGSKKTTIDIVEVRGHKEAGTFVEIEPNKQKTLLFSWEGPDNISFGEDGEYRFIWRKQAGVFNESINLTVNFPEGGSYISDIPPSLTGQSVLGYNTVLSRDFVSRISW